MEQLRVSVVPAGAFGTALGALAAENGHPVVLYNQNEAATCHFDRTREQVRLPGVVFPDQEQVRATSDLALALEDANVIVFAAPSREVRTLYEEVAKLDNGNASSILSAVKGFVGNKLVSEVLEEGRDTAVGSRLAVLSGPNFAHDIARGVQAETVIASTNGASDTFRRVLATDSFLVHTDVDFIGVQLGGALKNPYAIGYGILEANNLSETAKVRFKEQCLKEMGDLGGVMGAKRETFQGVSGRGDLDLTCSPPSRNFQAGVALGKGRATPQDLFESNTTIEGIYSVQGAMELTDKYMAELPIMETVWQVIYDGLSINEAVTRMQELVESEFRVQRGKSCLLRVL